MVRHCFFGSEYVGEYCLCGWTKDMKKVVPPEYIQNGIIKFYVVNSYTNSTVYGCSRSKQLRTKSPPKHLKAGKFTIFKEGCRVQTKGEWPEPMERYLNNALVEKHGKVLTCLGVVNQRKLKKKQQEEEGIPRRISLSRTPNKNKVCVCARMHACGIYSPF
jgi:hypothetical protein